MNGQYLRFKDLKQRKVVENRTTLQRWIATQGFPPGVLLGPRTRAWTEAEIEAYAARRRQTIGMAAAPPPEAA